MLFSLAASAGRVRIQAMAPATEYGSSCVPEPEVIGPSLPFCVSVTGTLIKPMVKMISPSRS